MKKISPIMLLLIMAACARGPKELPVLDIASAISRNVPDAITWNDLAEQVTLIPIETSDEILIGGNVRVLHVGDDSYWIACSQTRSFTHVDKSGKVITKFSRFGRGPGEYSSFTLGLLYFNRARGTILASHHAGSESKFIEYDQTGRFIRDIPMPTELSTPIFVADNYYVIKGVPSRQSTHKMYVTDTSFNILHSLFPLPEEHITTPRLNPMESQQLDMLLVDLYDSNDDEVVYRITEKGAEPVFVLKAGQYRHVLGEPTGNLPNGDRSPELRYLNVASIPNYYIIMYLRFPRGEQSQYRYVELWDKKTNEIVSRSGAMITGGTFNLAGHGFDLILPSGKRVKVSPDYIYEDTVVSTVQADDIYDKMDGVKIDDNPVIVHIKLKK